jgi:hypothetical protein
MFTEQHADSAIDSFFSLCESFVCGGRWEPPRSEEELRRLWGLLECHSLTPILFHCIDDLESILPEDRVSELRMRRLGQAARNALAVHQLEEIARAFGERGIPVIALKGAAAILWLYDDIACRTITDLDLLVPEHSIDAAPEILESLGYSSKPAHSPEVERATILEKLDHGEHLSPYFRPGGFGVEIHTNFLKRREKLDLVPDEIWSRAVLASPEVPGLLRLSTMDFLLHGVVHYPQHIEVGIPPLKFLVDMALAVRKYSNEVDWELFWNTANRWDIRRPAEVMMATVAHHFRVDVPGLPSESPHLNTDALINGILPLWTRDIMPHKLLPQSQELSVKRAIGGYWESILKARRLSSWRERLGYLFHLIFPEPDYMRHRYKIPEGRPVAPYYIIHPFVLVKNFFAGLASAVRASRTRRLR